MKTREELQAEYDEIRAALALPPAACRSLGDNHGQIADYLTNKPLTPAQMGALLDDALRHNGGSKSYSPAVVVRLITTIAHLTGHEREWLGPQQPTLF